MDTIGPDATYWRERLNKPDPRRDDDPRNEYERDKARIIHSAAFRRLQGKTQVMGVGEGDFHRTRLTHSIEAAQIGEGLLLVQHARPENSPELKAWLPKQSLIDAACYAHDIGHPPFGHGGERALHSCMVDHGGFEGNAQTLRILTKLEKYRKHQGINPTRRTILAVLKYPTPFDEFDPSKHKHKPPKCFYSTEKHIIDWALKDLPPGDKSSFSKRGPDDKPLHKTLDASIMECADDIAYAIHDLEDIVARHLITSEELIPRIATLFSGGESFGHGENKIKKSEFDDGLFNGGYEGRKRLIGKLVHTFIAGTEINECTVFSHPLLRYRLDFREDLKPILKGMKELTFKLVVEKAQVQQLELRGQRIVKALFAELSSSPERLIPRSAWESLDPTDTEPRRVCDYIAGMTDPFAERIYHRLFTPGFGSSSDEI